MLTIRELYNLVLCRLGIRKLLPTAVLRSVTVIDNCEELALLPAQLAASTLTDPRGRVDVVRRLERVARRLANEGYGLKVFELYRSPQAQTARKKELKEQLCVEAPELTDSELETQLRRRIAGVGGGHQTGGAVDLTMYELSTGENLDMGTAYKEHNNKTATNASGLSDQQQANRMRLKKVMEDEGFVNYPAEWWHYSYGDKMWAAYRGKSCAIYDVLTSDDTC